MRLRGRHGGATVDTMACSKNNNQPTECSLWQERAALGFQVPPHDDYADADVPPVEERILQASEADADAERRAFLKAFEADDQERRRDEALESALRAYEPTSPTSASVSVHDIQ